MTHPRKIETNYAPKAIGPYSQAVQAGPYLFVSGQIPLDVQSGQVVGGGIEEQAHRVLDHLEAILGAAGMSWHQVVKVEIYMTDLNDFELLNEIYAARVNVTPMPARQVVQVSRLPKNVLLEISCVAHSQKSS